MTPDNIPASLGAHVPIRIVFVVARSENGVIGHDGKLPWHIPSDLQFFKRVTLGKPIIMGRKTYESIGKPLPRRLNIVVTRDANWRAEGTVTAGDLPSALAVAYEEAHRTGVDEIAVIGGGEIFRQAFVHADRVYLTEVHLDVPGDAVFDLALPTGWHETSRERHAPDTPGGPPFSFIVWDRVKG
jgi:dihydrofolate reductase